MSGLCNALLRDRAEAEDAAQQTFLAAHRALLNGSAPREPAAWLATIARNECWGRIRARMREPLPTDELETQSLAADPLTEAIRRADLAALWRAIAELPRQQRDALLLREFGGLSYEELAGALAVTGPAVESLLFRARQGVRARLQTAYAALSGVGWVETLIRLLAGASSSAAPVAAKAVVVAAVATGGVVVAPHVFDQQHRARPHHAVHVRLNVVQAVQAEHTAAPAATPPIFVAAHPAVLARGSDGGGSSSGEGSSGDGSRPSGSGDERQTLASRQKHDGGHDGGDVESRQATPAAVPEDSSSGSDGGEGSSSASSAGGGDQPSAPSGGLAVPMPNPAVTVAAPPGDETASAGD